MQSSLLINESSFIITYCLWKMRDCFSKWSCSIGKTSAALTHCDYSQVLSSVLPIFMWNCSKPVLSSQSWSQCFESEKPHIPNPCFCSKTRFVSFTLLLLGDANPNLPQSPNILLFNTFEAIAHGVGYIHWLHIRRGWKESCRDHCTIII